MAKEKQADKISTTEEKNVEEDISTKEKQATKEQVKKELKEEELKKKKAIMKEREEQIKAIRKKKNKTGDDKFKLDRLMKERAKDNRELPKNLEELQPSQMTLEEMKEYCEKNNIKFVKGDTTVMLRTRIKAFRNPGQEERVRMLEERRIEGRIVK